MSLSSRRSSSGQTTQSRVFDKAWSTVVPFLATLTARDRARLKKGKTLGRNVDTLASRYIKHVKPSLNPRHHRVVSEIRLLRGRFHCCAVLSTVGRKHPVVIDLGFRRFDRKAPWPLVEVSRAYQDRVSAL